MEESLKRTICPCCGKVSFAKKSEVKGYIERKNKRCGGDALRPYYSIQCGCYHLTTDHSNMPKVRYNRVNQKEMTNSILKSYGL